MGQLINLLKYYPQASRPIDCRAQLVTDQCREVASQFGESYFDGDRLTGYGGYHYHPRFWRKTAELMIEYYGLDEGSCVLDVGCAKGFLLYELMYLLPGISVVGLDISDYALVHAKPEVKPFVARANAKSLPLPDNSFDLVIAINVLHSLNKPECALGFKEIERVSRRHAFVVNDAWHNNEQKQRLLQWNLTGKTFMHVDHWSVFFKEVGYTGDYWWFIAE